MSEVGTILTTPRFCVPRPRCPTLRHFFQSTVSRLFYPSLFIVTAALTAMLWARQGMVIQWLTQLGTAVAQAQSPLEQDNRPPRYNVGRRIMTAAPRAQPAAQANYAAPAARQRQTPLTKLQIETPGGPGAMEVTKPVTIPTAKVVARIGSEVVLAADVMPIVREQFEMLARNHPPEQHETLLFLLTRKAVAEAVQGKLIVAAMKEEIPKDKWGEVEKDIVKKFDIFELPGLLKHWKVKNEFELDKKLKEKGSSLKIQKLAFVDKALIGEWLRKEVKYDENVGHEEMLRYYEGHLAEYEFKAKVRFEEIRVNYGRQRAKPAAWETIQRLARQVYAGAPLAEIAKVHSDAASSLQNGLNDWTNKGSIKHQPLDQALFQLPLGVLSQIFDDGRGFVVVRVVERKEAGATSFQEAQSGIQKTIKAQREKAAREKKLAEFLEKQKSRAWTIYDEDPQNAAPPGAARSEPPRRVARRP